MFLLISVNMEIYKNILINFFNIINNKNIYIIKNKKISLNTLCLYLLKFFLLLESVIKTNVKRTTIISIIRSVIENVLQ